MIFVDYFLMTSLVACNTLIAVTVFLAVKMMVKIETNKVYYYGYIAFVWIYPLAVSLHSFILMIQFSV